MNPRWGLLLALVLAPVLAARAAPEDAPKSDSELTAAQREVQALDKEYNDAQLAFSKAYRDAKTQEEKEKLFTETYPRPEKYVPRFMELAKKHANDPAAADALIWVVSNAGRGKEGAEAIDILLKDHLSSPKLGDVCLALSYAPSAAAEKLLRAAAKDSPHHDVQGKARFCLAGLLKRKVESARALKDPANAEQIPSYKEFYGEEYVAALLTLDADALEKEIEPIYEDVAEHFGDIKHYRGTFADAAQSELFELRYLSIGKEAPDIEGSDIDEKAFKLSDYRGKVVVLDFWGDW